MNSPPITSFLLFAWIVCSPASLYSTTLKFKSGATFEGEVLGFKGSNSVVMANGKDGKPYTVTLAMLDDKCQRDLVRQKAARATWDTSAQDGPWQKDRAWLSNQDAFYALKAKALRAKERHNIALNVLSSKQTVNLNVDADERQVRVLRKELDDLNSQALKLEAKQKEIVARYRLRELKE